MEGTLRVFWFQLPFLRVFSQLLMGVVPWPKFPGHTNVRQPPTTLQIFSEDSGVLTVSLLRQMFIHHWHRIKYRLQTASYDDTSIRTKPPAGWDLLLTFLSKIQGSTKVCSMRLELPGSGQGSSAPWGLQLRAETCCCTW